MPFIREPISRWCDPGNPMPFQARRTDILSPTTVQQQFRIARKAAERPDITFHTLRATHATMLLICGGTIRECMDDLGHAGERIAIQHYQRIVPEHRREAVERMADVCVHLDVDGFVTISEQSWRSFWTVWSVAE